MGLTPRWPWARQPSASGSVVPRRCYLPASVEHAAGGRQPRSVRNVVSSAKYVPLISFVPRALYAQLCRAANVYFVLIAALQLATDLSPTGRYTTILPLAAVVGLSMVREALEDYQRHRVDRRVNNRTTRVLRDGAFVTCCWRELRVGDIVQVQMDEEFPADLVRVPNDTPNLNARSPSRRVSLTTCARSPPGSGGALDRSRGRHVLC